VKNCAKNGSGLDSNPLHFGNLDSSREFTFPRENKRKELLLFTVKSLSSCNGKRQNRAKIRSPSPLNVAYLPTFDLFWVGRLVCCPSKSFLDVNSQSIIFLFLFLFLSSLSPRFVAVNHPLSAAFQPSLPNRAGVREGSESRTTTPDHDIPPGPTIETICQFLGQENQTNGEWYERGGAGAREGWFWLDVFDVKMEWNGIKRLDDWTMGRLDDWTIGRLDDGPRLFGGWRSTVGESCGKRFGSISSSHQFFKNKRKGGKPKWRLLTVSLSHASGRSLCFLLATRLTR
jgi:hypothetical protein